MDSIKNEVSNAVGKEEQQAGQPGNSVEKGVDNAVNSSKASPSNIHISSFKLLGLL